MFFQSSHSLCAWRGSRLIQASSDMYICTFVAVLQNLNFLCLRNKCCGKHALVETALGFRRYFGIFGEILEYLVASGCLGGYLGVYLDVFGRILPRDVFSIYICSVAEGCYM